jgi:hypothetical protein
VLAAALAVVLADELADGIRAAALPLIRHDFGLSYGQLGLLAPATVLCLAWRRTGGSCD